ncbi:hypothetical protein MMA231_01664 [Asticcacaulis sp. MM231]|uniref:hypothetical protein n=1 Tax=Asticcacaulis sp. MM231 TaxID=3157666 RepID=UPI0032D59ECE
MPLTKNEIRSVCVFCGSAFGKDPAYKQAAHDLGQILAGAAMRLVYGGGGVGLMGETARSVHEFRRQGAGYHAQIPAEP